MFSKNVDEISGFQSREFWGRYFVAVWTVGLTLLITILISPLVPPDISSLFLIAVMVSAWRGGLGVGIFATFLSALIDIFIFLPASASFSLENSDFVQLLVDVFAAVVVGTLSASRKRAEVERVKLLSRETAARVEAEKANQIKDEFLAAVSHELRTPLTTIRTLTRLLIKKTQADSESRDYLVDISSECDRQIDLVHNLLDLSRMRAGGVQVETERVNLVEVFQICEKSLRIGLAEKQHKLTIDPATDLFVRADRNALRRVFCTIIENSIKFTPDQGVIELRAFQDPENLKAIVEISDNGRGIAENDLPHIFESFYQGSGKKSIDKTGVISGIGLGLYLAHSLIEAMDGEISVKSKLGCGTTFIMSFPLWEKEAKITNYQETKSFVEIGERV